MSEFILSAFECKRVLLVMGLPLVVRNEGRHPYRFWCA